MGNVWDVLRLVNGHKIYRLACIARSCHLLRVSSDRTKAIKLGRINEKAWACPGDRLCGRRTVLHPQLGSSWMPNISSSARLCAGLLAEVSFSSHHRAISRLHTS